MIILMITLYYTIHCGDNVYYNVSEDTWKCYCKCIRQYDDMRQGTVQLFQGGWGIQMKEQNGYDST